MLIASLYLVAEMSDRSMLLCELSLILLPYLLLICMAGLYSAALNGVKHFVVPAVAPIVLNLIWLGGGLLAAKQLAAGDDEVRIISAFIVIGGMVQLSMVIYHGRKFGITLTGRSVEAA